MTGIVGTFIVGVLFARFVYYPASFARLNSAARRDRGLLVVVPVEVVVSVPALKAAVADILKRLTR